MRLLWPRVCRCSREVREMWATVNSRARITEKFEDEGGPKASAQLIGQSKMSLESRFDQLVAIMRHMDFLDRNCTRLWEGDDPKPTASGWERPPMLNGKEVYWSCRAAQILEGSQTEKAFYGQYYEQRRKAERTLPPHTHARSAHACNPPPQAHCSSSGASCVQPTMC
jgi:hypothetical protein